MLVLISPIRLNLPNIILDDNFIISLSNSLAIIIMVDPLLAITVNHVLTQQTNCFVCYLTFSCALFGREKKSDGILSSSTLLILRW